MLQHTQWKYRDKVEIRALFLPWWTQYTATKLTKNEKRTEHITRSDPAVKKQINATPCFDTWSAAAAKVQSKTSKSERKHKKTYTGKNTTKYNCNQMASDDTNTINIVCWIQCKLQRHHLTTLSPSRFASPLHMYTLKLSPPPLPVCRVPLRKRNKSTKKKIPTNSNNKRNKDPKNSRHAHLSPHTHRRTSCHMHHFH